MEVSTVYYQKNDTVMQIFVIIYCFEAYTVVIFTNFGVIYGPWHKPEIRPV